MDTPISFNELGLSENTLRAVTEKGFEEPTPIQARIIPLLLGGNRDIVGRAQTGTGKTAAFGLPLIDMLERTIPDLPDPPPVKVIILVPTRELAVQVSAEIYSLKGSCGISILPVYGGQSYEHQIKRLRKGVHIVVGTPGRVLDHIGRKTLKLDAVSDVVLDEADEMLDMGFIEDVEEILAQTPPERRTMLFSATMPQRILDLAKKRMKDYVQVSIESDKLTVNLTEQIYFEVEEQDKPEALCRIIDMEDEFYGLIFCHTKIDTDRIARLLINRGYEAAAMHGDISQSDRERILGRFRSRAVPVLVATDVAARGIDIEDLTHVINFSLPRNPEKYIHRIGRTGRAGKRGTAITFITPEEYRKLMFIKRITKADINRGKVPEVSQVIDRKRAKIKSDIIDLASNESSMEYDALAVELLETTSPRELVRALLTHSFRGELDEKRYAEIREIGRGSVDVKGKTRLFVGLGKRDGMTARKLVAFLKQQTAVPEKMIQEVQVYDSFSFISVPFREAETIVEVLGKRNRGDKPMVKPATERQTRGKVKVGKKGSGKPRVFKSYHKKQD
jgi:ATP-dependent RNA helicase DeaD